MKRKITPWVLLGLFVVLDACTPMGVITNIPSDRLSSETYTSPGGEFTVKIPPLIRPGTRIQERQISPLVHVVAFLDDFGRVYTIRTTDNRKLGLTLNRIAMDFQVGEFLRLKEIIDTDRGPELRLAGVKKEGSPFVTRTRASGVWKTKKNDLFEAKTIFLHGNDIYEIGAGVTFSMPGGKDEESDQLAKAERNLDIFLGGLITKSR